MPPDPLPLNDDAGPSGLLNLLRCPETMQTLVFAPADLLARVNRDVLPDRSGRPLDPPLEAALVRQDGALLFPIRDGVPILLLETAIDLPRLPLARDAL